MGRMRSALPFDVWRMLRFGAVGLLNTALGYSLILAGLALGLGDIVSMRQAMPRASPLASSSIANGHSDVPAAFAPVP